MNLKENFEICDKQLLQYVEQYFNAKYIPFSSIEHLFGEKEQKYLAFISQNLKYPIALFVKEDLHANMSNYYMQDTCNIIMMKQVPTDEISLLEVCHEFGHIYLCCKGYPCVTSEEDIAVIYKTIATNVLHDPIINKMLSSYGMDIKGYLRKSIEYQLNQIGDAPIERQMDIWGRHYTKCLLIEKLQEWKIIRNEIPNPFEIIAKSKLPSIYKESVQFVKKIEAIGTNKPAKCKRLYLELIKENNLDKKLNVTDIHAE